MRNTFAKHSHDINSPLRHPTTDPDRINSSTLLPEQGIDPAEIWFILWESPSRWRTSEIEPGAQASINSKELAGNLFNAGMLIYEGQDFASNFGWNANSIDSICVHPSHHFGDLADLASGRHASGFKVD